MGESFIKPRRLIALWTGILRHQPAFKSDYVLRLFQQCNGQAADSALSLHWPLKPPPQPPPPSLNPTPTPPPTSILAMISTEQLLEMIRKSDCKVRKPQSELIHFSTGQLPTPRRPWTWSAEAWSPPPPSSSPSTNTTTPVTWNHHQRRRSLPSLVIIIKS